MHWLTRWVASSSIGGIVMNESSVRSIAEALRDVAEFVLELVKVVLISLAIILPIRYFLVQPFYVKGASMEPTFVDHEYLLIDEISYRFNSPKRGDVVVFRYPKDPRQFFIKRVIGLPGETVTVSKGKITIVNAEHPEGFVLEEAYLDGSHITNGDETTTVPADNFFVLGDNRAASLDSRAFGTVSSGYLIGRVWIRAWPFERWTVYPYLQS